MSIRGHMRESDEIQRADARVEGGAPLDVARRRRVADLYVLDASFRVVLSWTSGKAHTTTTPLCESGGSVFTPPIDRVVRQVAAEMQEGERLVLVPPNLLLRIVELEGSAGLHYGVFAEDYQSRDSMREAARRYGISRREIEVLTLLVQGAATGEISAQLHIAETTVQDHIKNIAAKTHARSRTEIVAKVLGGST